MPAVNSDGVNIYYEVQGQGEPIVMIMGYTGNSMAWGKLPAEFTRLSYKVITVDNRGTGRSDKPDAPVTMSMMADDVCRVMDAISLKKASVFGISMGGMIAQEFALNHPDRLNYLVLGCTSPGGSNAAKINPEVAGTLFAMGDTCNFAEQNELEYMRMIWSDEFINSNTDLIREYLRNTMVYPTPPHVFIRQAEAINRHDTWDRLPSIKAPTMIIAGTEDPIIPHENSKLLKARIPNSELTLLQNKKHCFFIEAMDSTRIFINEFIKRQRSQ